MRSRPKKSAWAVVDIVSFHCKVGLDGLSFCESVPDVMSCPGRKGGADVKSGGLLGYNQLSGLPAPASKKLSGVNSLELAHCAVKSWLLQESIRVKS